MALQRSGRGTRRRIVSRARDCGGDPMSNSPDGSRRNPFLAQITEAAAAEVAAEKLERRTHDEFLLAHAALSDVLRRMREGQEVHTLSGGGYIVDRVTGKAIRPEARERAEAKVNEAQAAYSH